MASLKEILSGLLKAEQQLERQLGNVRAAISSLRGGETGARRGRPAGSKNKKGIIIVGGRPRKRRRLSAKARKAISDAQKARWAKQKAGEKKKK
jgi:hypothetical protein